MAVWLLTLNLWLSCKNRVFLCATWSFDEFELGERVISSDKGNIN